MGYVFFESERLIYRTYCLEDLQDVHAQFNEKSRRRWFYFQEPDCLTLEFAEREVRSRMVFTPDNINLLSDDFGLGISLKYGGDLIGFIGLSKFHGDEELEDVEVGYQISEPYQGSGYATEAARAAVQWGLKELRRIGAKAKIVAKIEHENLSSRRVAEKAGMTFVRAEKYVSVYEITG